MQYGTKGNYVSSFGRKIGIRRIIHSFLLILRHHDDVTMIFTTRGKRWISISRTLVQAISVFDSFDASHARRDDDITQNLQFFNHRFIKTIILALLLFMDNSYIYNILSSNRVELSRTNDKARSIPHLSSLYCLRFGRRRLLKLVAASATTPSRRLSRLCEYLSIYI